MCRPKKKGTFSDAKPKKICLGVADAHFHFYIHMGIKKYIKKGKEIYVAALAGEEK